MLDQDRQQINDIRRIHGLTYEWMAERTGENYHTVRRQLSTAKNYRQDFHKACETALKKEGFIVTNKEHCKKLYKNVLKCGAKINRQLSILLTSTENKIEDDDFNSSEAHELLAETQLTREAFNDALDKFVETIKAR